MDAENVNIYEACDRAIKAMNRENLEAFGRLKTAKFDELTVVQRVLTLYRTMAKKARKRYYEVAFEAYLIAMSICDIDPKTAHRMAEDAGLDDLVKEWLEGIDPVTMYRFDTEMERKANRLIEALSVSGNPAAEIDKALRFWSMMLGQYAINVTDYAEQKAFEDADVVKAMWVTQKDERVCHECHALDGQVFTVAEFPPKPHWGCRCRKIPVRE